MKILRLWFTIVLSAVLPSCSSAIYGSGRFADVLSVGSNRERIRAELGKPVTSGLKPAAETGAVTQSQEPIPYDVFGVEGPVYDYGRYLTTSLRAGMSLGLTDVFEFPSAIAWRVANTGPQMVTVYYDNNFAYGSHFVTRLETSNISE